MILLTLPKLGKPSCFPIYPKSQMWCDSGVVFEFLVTGVLLAKWKHLLHWSKTNPSCSKWSPLHFSKIASGHSAWRVHAMPTRKTASLPHTHTYIHRHPRLPTKSKVYAMLNLHNFSNHLIQFQKTVNSSNPKEWIPWPWKRLSLLGKKTLPKVRQKSVLVEEAVLQAWIRAIPQYLLEITGTLLFG